MIPHKQIALTALFALTSAIAPTAFADDLIIIIDISDSTPVLQPSYQRVILPKIGDQIRKLPIGSRVKVFTAGDDTAPPLTIERYVQRRRNSNGDVASKLASEVPKMLASYLVHQAQNPSLAQNESSLSPALLDASKSCQGGPCTITYLTDGCEFRPGVIAWPQQYKMALPDIPGLDLKGANVLMYGVGQGVSSDARIAIEQHWNSFLKRHHAGNIQLIRI